MPQTGRSVTVIPSTISPTTHLPRESLEKRRVAGYARVSTDKDEQFTSYEAQIDYYTQYIKRNPAWEFVAVYTDEGLSGLNAKNRDGFNTMVSDALAGKIDLIVTKSVSRFARNTVDSLVTVRKLKEKGIEVYFEKENIYTLDSKGELLITIMSSLAQEESRSLSENITWGQRKRFADGKISLPYKQFLGYKRGEDGLPEIVEEEAKIVRRIYRAFIDGKTVGAIARMLTAEGIPTPGGKSTWRSATVQSILTNEKYRGDARLQKAFTVDFLTKKKKVNEGEVPQYYVSKSHEAIIRPDDFDRVQAEFERRKTMGRSYSSSCIFSSKIVCGDCGAFYGSKVWHSTDKYRHIIWRCNAKFDNETQCKTPSFSEDELKGRFVTMFNGLIKSRDSMLEDLRIMQTELTDSADIDRQIKDAMQELNVLSELMRQTVEQNSCAYLNQEEYIERYSALEKRHTAARNAAASLQKACSDRKAKADAMGRFILSFAERTDVLTEFDAQLWLATVERVTAYRDGRFLFRLTTGMEVEG